MNVTFIVNEQTEQSLNPRVEIHVRFVSFKLHNRAIMEIQIVEKEMFWDDKPGQIIRVLHEQRIPIQGWGDCTLARATGCSDISTAEEIAHGLFWEYVAIPSVEVGDQSWLKQHAPEYWNSISEVILSSRERQCEKVHTD